MDKCVPYDGLLLARVNPKYWEGNLSHCVKLTTHIPR